MTAQEAFARALQYHQAGRLGEAETLYRQVLAMQPNHSGAHANLGEVCRTTGRLEEAMASLRRALALEPNLAEAWNNLGIALKDRGELDEATAAYLQAIAHQPDFAAAHNNLGNVLRERAQFAEAEAAYRRALHFHPRHPQAWNNLGITLKGQHHLEPARAAFQRAIQLQPDYPEAYYNLGNALEEQNRHDDAVAAYHQALHLKPDYAEAHGNLGVALAARGQWDEAVAAYRRAIQLHPGSAEVFNNLGAALKAPEQRDEAIAHYRQALQLKPDYADAHCNLGVALVEQGRFEEGLTAYRRALQLKPDFATAKFNLSLLLLLRGDFGQAWPLFESRWEALRRTERRFPHPRWDGSAVDGRRVLLHAEEGFGDSIEFIRYAPLAAERGAEVIVECPSALVELFRAAQGVREVIADGERLPPFDLHLPLLSLPWAFQTVPETIPRNVPYLFADPARGGSWRARLGEHARLRVGLVWAGNPENIPLRKRDIPLKSLAPLLAIEGVDFFSLQMNDARAQLRSFPGAESIVDHLAHLRNFADTAAFMMELDLIITVDTATAHLAGALGRPVWTLLAFVADWRWGLECETTPWYPTMRLFRQSAAGDWDSVVPRVVEELRHVHAGRSHPGDVK